VKIWALCSHYDEDPKHLTEMVESLAPLCDGLVAVDGAYALYPSARRESPARASLALTEAVCDAGLRYSLYAPHKPWDGGEVEKRGFMFEHALTRATPYEDWFLIMDGDMMLGDCDPEAARAALAETDCEAGEVTFAELAYGSSTHTIHATGFRSLFRAVPGLTVEGTHWLYVVPDETRPSGRRFLWHGITGNTPNVWRHPPEPAVDVRDHITLLHRPHVRSRERVAARSEYYANRERAVAERVPIYDDPRH
jgi:hypothetical protein